MKKVYIAHPLRGENRAKNVEEVTRICKKITELFPDILPISPIHAFSFLDDCGEEGEKKALDLCLEMLKNCDEAWFFGKWHESEGCSIEFDTALVRWIHGPQDCEQILASAEFPPDKGPHVELARWLLEEVYEPELKPCPFCGGTPDTENVTRNYGHVVCRGVSCLVKPGITWSECNPCKTRAEAIAARNRRAE